MDQRRYSVVNYLRLAENSVHIRCNVSFVIGYLYRKTIVHDLWEISVMANIMKVLSFTYGLGDTANKSPSR